MRIGKVRSFMGLIIVFFVSIPYLLAEGRLLDRLVLEVNGKSYTQRQVEVYMLVRTIATERGTKDRGVTPENWQTVLDSFRDEILVLEGGLRTQAQQEAIQADPSAVRQLLKDIEEVQARESTLRSFIKDYRVTEQELLQAAGLALRVQKELQLRQPAGHRDLAWQNVDTKSQWYLDLRGSIGIREYDQARVYQRLRERRR